MRRKPFLACIPLLAAAIFGVPLFAHHGTAAFETDKRMTLKGTVTEWYWSNPHCLLRFDVKGENGEVTHWIGETQNPVSMTNEGGWSKAAIKTGDEVTVVLSPVKNGMPLGQIVTVTLPNGTVLNAFRGASRARDYK